MGTLISFFKEHAELSIALGVISLLFLFFGTARLLGFTAIWKLNTTNEEMMDESYEKYDGMDLVGSEVINAIKRHQNDVPITIYTGESVDTYHGSFKASNNNRGSEKYIKPSQMYEGSLLRDADNEVVSLIFAKEGVLLTDVSYKELLGNLTGLNPEDYTMEELINHISSTITSKNQAIQTLTDQVTALNNSVSNLQTQNNNLSSQLSTANSNYTTLQNQVTSGKSQIATAITNKGVSTSASASYSTMATNISKIPGKRYKGGTKTVNLQYAGMALSNFDFSESLGFKPSAVSITLKESYDSGWFYIFSAGEGSFKGYGAYGYQDSHSTMACNSFGDGCLCGAITINSTGFSFSASELSYLLGTYAENGTTTITWKAYE